MAATGHPVRVTIGTVWDFQVKPPPPRPQRLPAGVVAVWSVLAVVRIIFGVTYFKDCPQQPNIPNYLLGMTLITLLMIPFITLPCERPRDHPRGLKAIMLCFLGLFAFIWILLGDVWVFSIYQPNYDPKAADGLYCDKTLYTFAFWNAVYETAVFGVQLAQLCKGFGFYVVMTPAPTHTNVYGGV